ncbi:MAG: response regulator transcription factor [Phycisphaerae bacterium]|jgi:DNA-binding response OmpR family regulator|nr:response regulator transcription factor [Phycisphaerae bacterium]
MRVLIIEDNPKMAAALQRGLKDHGYATDVCHSGLDGEEMAANQGYDVVILDLMLPDRDGVQVCRNLRRRGSTTRIVMLTALSGIKEKVEGLDAGADDYLAKPFEIDELLARMRAVMRRSEASEARHLRIEDLELDLYSRTATRGSERIELSNKEFAMLEFLMRHPHRILSRAQIGEKVWDMNFEPTSNIVDVYISSLRKKIDRGYPQELIHTIKGAGYRFGVSEGSSPTAM